jgi:hypothetical protein
MAHGRWILSLQQGAAVAAGIGVVLIHLIHPLDWQRLRPSSRMVRLTAAFAATALAPHRWLKPRAVAGGCLEELRNLRKIRHRPGQRAGQGGELAAEFIVLLPWSMDLLLDPG